MQTKRFMAIFLTVLVFGAANAYAQTPDEVVKELYRIHYQDLKDDRDQILNAKNRKMLDKFFAKTLADLFWNDLTNRKKGVGALNFDPLYFARDVQVSNFLVGAPKTIATTSSVIVKFTNDGRKNTLSYQLTFDKKNWKIADIKYPDGSNLLGFFNKP